jgi:hypothetical protein
MANTLLTPTAVTREALRILHQKLNFVGTIERQYDDSFARSGAKIGDSLKIRLPNQYVVRTGKTLDVQDTGIERDASAGDPEGRRPELLQFRAHPVAGRLSAAASSIRR